MLYQGLKTEGSITNYRTHHINEIEALDVSEGTPGSVPGASNKGTSFSDNNVPQESDVVKFSKTKADTKKLDDDYKKAVDSGDIATAEKMVRQRAEKQLSNSVVRDANGELSSTRV